MIRLLRDFCQQEKLLTSDLVSEHTFYRAFSRDLKRARKKIVIESPFLTERRAAYYAPLFSSLIRRRFKIGINTRHPDCHDEKMKTQAKRTVQILLATGVELHTYNDLRHRKLAIIDNAILWEGSPNILSHGHSQEIMRRFTSSYLCHKMIDFAKIYH